MKRVVFSIVLVMVSFVLAGQGKPDWVDENLRQTKYPEHLFITGFAWIETNGAKTSQDVTQQAKMEAQAELSRKIRVQITSRITVETTAGNTHGQYRETENLTGSATAESDVELVGLSTTTYYDPAAFFSPPF